MKQTMMLILLMLSPAVLLAQEAERSRPRAERSGELQQEMRNLFKNRLRQALALSDEQMSEIGPRIEQLEDERFARRRNRTEAVQELRRGLESGASDAELQAQLDRLEKIERDQRESERAHMAAIDKTLSTRQRVQLRFFMEKFRTEMARKIREMRGDRRRGRDRGPRPRRDGP